MEGSNEANSNDDAIGIYPILHHGRTDGHLNLVQQLPDPAKLQN